ncbi:Bacteriophage abortive infection AbiH [Lutibacter oricola]|uniref:Bacteriophage abortive infection AbiH n=1 Tax=Lutibacter oricola TaxID=762486 RepID=A0A1H3GTW6_9FLAO|nr:AbiH family protein [Lutibacter oricola]SDY06756.1 Bacteriophage abortive infection AbiH [Lutibacter oricola]
MNRIILIGNGFDLAHNIPTSYKNFIDDYWFNTIEEIKNTYINRPYENNEIIIQESPSQFIVENTYQNLIETLKNHKTNPIKFKNYFLKIITEKTYLNKWVDVENEYYSLLKKSYKKPENNYSISSLNSDFNKIKLLLQKYLIQVQSDFDSNITEDILKTKKLIGSKIYKPFSMKDFSEDSLKRQIQSEYEKIKPNLVKFNKDPFSLEDFSEQNKRIISRIKDKSNHLKEIKKILLSSSATNYFDLNPRETLFLNFNYTLTEKSYDKPRIFSDYFADYRLTTTKTIHIHGTTDQNDNNPMIFGYGDEIDEDYKAIENLNDNNYLENIKSINYLESDNYKKLLEFLNTENYQVFLFGHSCGISDRTLLNTIFENKNCASIKLFYHQKTNSQDNYSDIIRNISRNFNDKTIMRDRVVNKMYCSALL